MFHETLVLIHLLGFAVLLGSVLFYTQKNNIIALRASIIQLLSGILLIFSDKGINHMKVGVKGLILLCIIILITLWRKKSWTKNQRITLGILIILNAAIATLR